MSIFSGGGALIRGNTVTISNGPATKGIPPKADANSWSLQVSFVSNNRSPPITEKNIGPLKSVRVRFYCILRYLCLKSRDGHSI